MLMLGFSPPRICNEPVVLINANGLGARNFSFGLIQR